MRISFGRQLTKEANVRCIHTKYMPVDPLSDEPAVVTGSANFSEASDTPPADFFAARTSAPSLRFPDG